MTESVASLADRVVLLDRSRIQTAPRSVLSLINLEPNRLRHYADFYQHARSSTRPARPWFTYQLPNSRQYRALVPLSCRHVYCEFADEEQLERVLVKLKAKDQPSGAGEMLHRDPYPAVPGIRDGSCQPKQRESVRGSSTVNLRVVDGKTRAALKDASASYWGTPADKLISLLRTTPNGLTRSQAARRLKVSGPNTLEINPPLNLLRLLARQFASPLILILLFAAAVSLFVGQWTDAAVIAAIVAGSGLISFAQEYSAGNAINKLRERLAHRATVFRDGRAHEVASRSIVPGDVIALSAGSLVPADSVVLEAKDFFVSQAALTGETFPVEKRVGEVEIDATLAERTNCVFMGTSVRSGTARVVVVRTGATTEYGQIARGLRRRAPETDFARGIRQFGLLLSRLMIGLILAVFAINIVSDKPPIDSLLFAIALAVGLSPELLPAIITICLSRGARNMAQHGVIVRRLDSIENLGSMDILCTDKTGTLTEGVIRLDGALDISGAPSEEVHRLAFLNARFQTGLSNPLDHAILASTPPSLDTTIKIGEVPYDFARKRLSVAVRSDDMASTIITKGAVDNVLGVCTQFRSNTTVAELTADEQKNIVDRYRKWSEEGFRVLAVASRKLPEDHSTVVRSDEADMTFEGFILFFDPPKPGVKETIASLAKLGVRLKLITGDNRYVAVHIAKQVGLANDRVMAGAELNRVADDALGHTVEHADLFAEVDPNQKERIIRALQKRGHVVGFLGDGINDAPAMHDADVGISVEGAVDVAREAADIVLLKKGLDVLRSGIMEGRRTFANSLKYIFTTTSANFGNMLSMAAASLFLPFLPLLAKQVLLNNFLSDIPAIAIAGDHVDAEYIERPHRWDMKFIRNFMIIFGLISAVFDVVTFGVLIYVFRVVEAQFQTAWFIESLLTELLVALVVRTARPFYKSRPSRWLVLSTAAIVILALVLPFVPGVYLFGFVPLPFEIMATILVITSLYLVVTEAAKRVFYRNMKIPLESAAM